MPKLALRRSERFIMVLGMLQLLQVQLKQAEAAENGSSDGRKETCPLTDLEQR